MKHRGGITVFLALILSILSAFIITLAGACRRYVSKSEAVLAMDNAVKSCFAEYNRELFEKYHILLIDSSYKSHEKGKERISDHFTLYMENGMSTNELCYVQIGDCENATELNNKYLYEAGVRYAKETGGIDERLTGSGDDAYFITYLLKVCTDDGDMEYMLYGFDSDEENRRLAAEDYGNEEDRGDVTYEQYLCSRLEDEGILLIRRRFGELVSRRMREGDSPGFDLDECYHTVTFTATLAGQNTGEYSIEREYSYDISGI